MPVEICILSGTRQGELIELDASTLRVGDTPSCDVYFDADHDHAAKGRRLVLFRTDDGWQLKNEGDEIVWVNHEPVSSVGALRSGDIVRLSQLGPDFSFTILSGPRQSKVRPDDSVDETQETVPATQPPSAPHEMYSMSSPPRSQLASSPPRRKSEPNDRPAHERTATTTSQGKSPAKLAPFRLKAVLALAAILVLATVIWVLTFPTEMRPPKLPELSGNTIREGETFTLSARVLDHGQPLGKIQYSLLDGEEHGIQIDAATGDIRWSPGEEHGPGNYPVTVQALAASGDHEARDEKSFVLEVLEVNQAPHIKEIPKQTIRLYEDVSLNVELHASDPDRPANRLKLTLGPGAPKGIQLDAQNSAFVWHPTLEQVGIHTLTIRVEDDGPQPLAAETSFDVEVIKPDPWRLAEKKARHWTVLVVGKAPETGEMFPFGSGVVFDRKAVVTNGLLATELAKRVRDGWRLYVYHPDGPSKYAAEQILIPKMFELSEKQPDEQIFFDMGIIEVKKPFSDIGQLALPSALDSLERGQPLACVAFPIKGQPLTRFSRPQATLTKCNIYLITRLTPELDDPGAPRLLHLAGDIPRNSYGGAIITADGQVVGIYAERAEVPVDGQGAKIDDLHYVTAPSLVEAWRRGTGTDLWKPPTVKPSANVSNAGQDKQDQGGDGG